MKRFNEKLNFIFFYIFYFKDVLTFIETADNEIPLSQMRKFPQSSRSINRYLESLTPTEEDKLHMAPFKIPNWKDFQNLEDILDPNEPDRKEKKKISIIQNMKAFPLIKVC